MKQLSTIICSLLFVIAGAITIGMKSKSTPILPGAMPAYAKPQPFSLNELNLPLDVQLDLNKRTKTDTIYVDTSRVDTVYKYKTKIRKVAVPEVVKETDTLYVPVFYLATPLEEKVESTEIIVVQGVQPDSCAETNHTGIEELE